MQLNHRNQGATLIEVLVSLVIMAMGLLGIARLQLGTLSMNLSAYHRSQATHLTSDIIERLRAIGIPNISNEAHLVATQSNNLIDLCNDSCETQQQIAKQLDEWQQLVKETLPQGESLICIDQTPNDGLPSAPNCDNNGNVLAVKIWWLDDKSQDMRDSEDLAFYSTRVQL
ncbi:MAG: type IV pilus modification protein PilV [Pseudomonadota bacterium]